MDNRQWFYAVGVIAVLAMLLAGIVYSLQQAWVGIGLLATVSREVYPEVQAMVAARRSSSPAAGGVTSEATES